jgi:hypothetical protein
MPQLKTTLATIVWVLSACSSHTPGPEVAPSPSQQKSAETTNRSSPRNSIWEFTPSEKSNVYRSTTTAIIHEVSTGGTRADTVKLNTRFTIRFNQFQTPTTVSGHIDNATVTQTRGPNSEANNPSPGIDFTGEVTNGELTVRPSTNQAECVSPVSSSLGEIRSVISTFSRTLSLASVWTDSISATTCTSSSISTTLKALRSYRVLGEANYFGTQVLVLERTEITNFSGSGNQEQHQVEIRGIGTGTTRIYLDRTTGNTVAVENTQKVDTEVRSSGRLRHFIQDVTQKIELIL